MPEQDTTEAEKLQRVILRLDELRRIVLRLRSQTEGRGTAPPPPSVDLSQEQEEQWTQERQPDT